MTTNKFVPNLYDVRIMIMFLKRVGEDHPGFRYGTPGETRVPPCLHMTMEELQERAAHWTQMFSRDYIVYEKDD